MNSKCKPITENKESQTGKRSFYWQTAHLIRHPGPTPNEQLTGTFFEGARAWTSSLDLVMRTLQVHPD